MHADPFVRDLIILLGLAAAGLVLFERLRLPAIAGFVVAGAAAGPAGLAWVAEPERIRHAAELGVVFLLFEIGLELPLETLRRHLRDALVAGALQIGGSVAAMVLLARALGFELAAAVALGMMAALSSTALVIRLLSERGQLGSPQGQLILGVLLLQDACFVPFLLAMPLLAGGAGATLGAVGWQVALTVGTALLFFGVVRGVVPHLLERVALLRSAELFSLLAILLAVGSAFAADTIGLSPAVGAFVTGLVAGSSRYAHQLVAEVVPLRGALLGLFFTAVGMLFDPRALVDHWPLAVALVVGITVFKAGSAALAVGALLRRGWRAGLGVGLPLAQAGEFSFVLASAATAAGLLDLQTQSVFIGASVLTLFLTPVALPAASWLASRGAVPETATPAARGGDEGHTVLIGYGLTGQSVGRVLRAIERDYVALESNPEVVRELSRRGEPVRYGDAMRPSVLQRLGVARALLVVVAVNDPVATRRVVALVHQMAPEVPIVVRSPYVASVDQLAATGASSVVVDELEATLELVAEVLGRYGTPEEAVRRFTDALREEGYVAIRGAPALPLDPWLIEELEQVGTESIAVPDGFAPRTLAALGARARTGASVLLVERPGARFANPGPDVTLRGGDRILVLGSAEQVAALQRLIREPPLAGAG